VIERHCLGSMPDRAATLLFMSWAQAPQLSLNLALPSGTKTPGCTLGAARPLALSLEIVCCVGNVANNALCAGFVCFARRPPVQKVTRICA